MFDRKPVFSREPSWLDGVPRIAVDTSTTTRTPLADVDTSRLDLTIEKACALIDRLQAEKAALLEALRDVHEYLDMMLSPCEEGCDCLVHTVAAAIAKADELENV